MLKRQYSVLKILKQSSKMMLVFFVSTLLLSTTLAQQCKNAKISDIKTYSTRDTVLNSQTTYVVEFRAQCAGNLKNAVFYTEFYTQHLTSSSDESGERYQLTWTEPNSSARSQQIEVKIYDEEGFMALKKAQRSHTDTNSIKEVATVSFYHTGSYRGPTIQIEFLVTIVFGGIFYWALTNKNKLQA